MNKIVFFFGVTLAALLVNFAVEGQLMCFVGTRVTNAGVTSGSLTSSACPFGMGAACHIFDVTVTTAGQPGMTKLIFN